MEKLLANAKADFAKLAALWTQLSDSELEQEWREYWLHRVAKALLEDHRIVVDLEDYDSDRADRFVLSDLGSGGAITGATQVPGIWGAGEIEGLLRRLKSESSGVSADMLDDDVDAIERGQEETEPAMQDDGVAFASPSDNGQQSVEAWWLED